MNKACFEMERQYKALDKIIKYSEQEKENLRKFYPDKKLKSMIFYGSG